MSIPTPIKSVACQELLELEKTKEYGPLRRRTMINKLVDKIIQNFKWQQNYVLIHNGCLYFYANETSAYPSKTTSLYGFDDCSECTLGEYQNCIPWAFRINNALNENKCIFLAAVSRVEMKKWIGSLKEEIYAVNNVIRPIEQLPIPYKPEDFEEDNDSDYEDLADEDLADEDVTSVDSYDSNITSKNKQNPPLPQKKVAETFEPEINTSKYIETASIQQKFEKIISSEKKPSYPKTAIRPPTHPKPSLPPQANSKTLLKAPPILLPKPKPVSTVRPMRAGAVKKTEQKPRPLEYELNEPQGFWSKDPGEGEKLLMTKSAGTFIVRGSKITSDHPLTLLVKAEFGPLKKYQIFKTEGKYHLERGSRDEERFLTVDHLITHFKNSNLPSKQGLIILNQPYHLTT